MVSYEPSDGSRTSRSVHMDFLLAEAPDRPTIGRSDFTHDGISDSAFGKAMPVIPVGFHDQFGRLEHEVWLPSSEHRLVHLEPEATLLKLIMQKALDGSHLRRKGSPQTGLAMFLSAFSREFAPKKVFIAKHRLAHSLASLGCIGSTLGLAHFLSGFSRSLPSKGGLANLLSSFRRYFPTEVGLTCLLPMFGGPFVKSPYHPMPNYNRNHG